MTQGGVIRKLLTRLTGVKLYGLHQTINVTFQHNAVIDDGSDFIDNLRRGEAGIRNHSDTEKQRFPVLHTFSISINRNADYVANQLHNQSTS